MCNCNRVIYNSACLSFSHHCSHLDQLTGLLPIKAPGQCPLYPLALTQPAHSTCSLSVFCQGVPWMAALLSLHNSVHAKPLTDFTAHFREQRVRLHCRYAKSSKSDLRNSRYHWTRGCAITAQGSPGALCFTAGLSSPSTPLASRPHVLQHTLVTCLAHPILQNPFSVSASRLSWP